MRSVRSVPARMKASNRSASLSAEQWRLRTFVNWWGLITTTGTSGRLMATSWTPASARMLIGLRNPAVLYATAQRSSSPPCESMIETARPQTSVPGCVCRFVP
jgi:hypothetical protein